MQRRTFLLGGSAFVAASGLGLYAAKAQHQFDLAALLIQLQAWRGKKINHSGTWSAAEVLQHCAQSIAGSLDGYPEHKSALFQYSVGKLALSTFQAAGAMHHPLSEPIPGMARLDPQLSTAESLELLIVQVERFLQSSEQALQPHFAYGQLHKSDYQAAHFLHISQHLTELSLALPEV